VDEFISKFYLEKLKNIIRFAFLHIASFNIVNRCYCYKEINEKENFGYISFCFLDTKCFTKCLTMRKVTPVFYRNTDQ